MLAVAALIGADARVPAMVLQRAPLGRRGSYLPTALNILQCLGWAIFELIVIATAAGLLCDKLFGFKAVWAWKLLFGVVAAVLALLGPVGLRAPLRTEVRDLGGPCIRRLPRLVDRRRRKPRPELDRRRAQGVLLARGRHRRRRHRVLGAARRRLHTLLAGPAQRVLRGRDRLLPADALPVRVRLDPRAVARARSEQAGIAAGRDRRGRACGSARTPGAHRRRDRRGVRERLLGVRSRRRTSSRRFPSVR